VKQLDHQFGVIEAIDSQQFGDSKSKRLAQALKEGVPIIIVTIQTFPFAMEAILTDSTLKDRSFAVIIDEAHSSQGGEASKKMNEVLSAGGKLFVAVPNMNSYDARYYKEYWAAYDVPRHLYHFKKQDIAKFFMSNGFELEKVIPMKFDSYYVSMLSEKYKKRFSLFGVLIGFLSNMKGKKYGYSSQVYVLRKK
jgi:hypothetical protein